MRRFARAVAVGLAVGACCLPMWGQVAAPKIADEEVARQVDKVLQGMADADKFSGAVLVARGGKPIFKKAYGMASREFGVPNTPETMFNIGSIEKLFTRISISQLLDAGKIASVDDKLGKYLPEYPNMDARDNVTIRQLLNMQSGIGDFFGDKFDVSSKDAFRTLKDYLPLFANEPLQFRPGADQKYSNGGYIVLGLVIEKLSGQSYYEYVKEHICVPLGLSSTGFPFADVPVKGVAEGYTHHGLQEWPELHKNAYTLPARGSSAGGGYSTVGDLLLLANAIREEKIKNPEFEEGAPKAADGGFQNIRGIGIAGGAPGLNGVVESGLPGGYTIVVLANLDPPTAQITADALRPALGLPAPQRRMMRPGPPPGAGPEPNK